MPLWATGVRLSKDFSEKKCRQNLRHRLWRRLKTTGGQNLALIPTEKNFALFYHWVSSRYSSLYCLAEFSQETSLSMSR